MNNVPGISIGVLVLLGLAVLIVALIGLAISRSRKSASSGGAGVILGVLVVSGIVACGFVFVLRSSRDREMAHRAAIVQQESRTQLEFHLRQAGQLRIEAGGSEAAREAGEISVSSAPGAPSTDASSHHGADLSPAEYLNRLEVQQGRAARHGFQGADSPQVWAESAQRTTWLQAIVLGILALTGLVLVALRRRGGARIAAVVIGLLLVGGFLLFSRMGFRSYSSRSHPVPSETWSPGTRERLSVDRSDVRVEATGEMAEVRNGTDSEPAGNTASIAVRDDQAAWSRSSALESAGEGHQERGWEPVGIPSASSKPWVRDAAGAKATSETVGSVRFEYYQPGPDGGLVGYSDIEPSLQLAHEKADAAAAEKIAVLALKGLREERVRFDVERALPLAIGISQKRVPSLERDRCDERSERGYATVFRSAVRIELDEPALHEIESMLAAELASGWMRRQADLRAWLLMGIGAFVLAVSVFLLYTFLNAGTKGHFAWPLRIVSAVVFLLICGAVWFVRVHLG